jgi:arylsulfatase A-like enzyme
MRTLILTLLSHSILSLAAQDKPNVVLIIADDIGFADISCQGATHIETPAIDSIAKDGLRFTDAHSSASTCTPTRRALLTGVYSWRQSPGSSISPGDAPSSILPNQFTIAKLFKQAGYQTAAIGKWHLGLGPESGPDWNNEITPGPLDIGFDRAFLIPATGDRVPTIFLNDRRLLNLDPKDPIQVSYKEKVGTEPTGKQNPELLKLKHTHGHDATIVNGIGRIGWMTGGTQSRWKDEDIADTIATHATQFIEAHQQEPFFLYFATHGIHVPRAPHQRFVGKSRVGTRGDVILELDATVDTILKKLDELKLSENTIVIFTSDNGAVFDDGYEDYGTINYHPNAPYAGRKGTLYEGGHRVPFLIRWPVKIKANTVTSALFAQQDLLASFSSYLNIPLPSDQNFDSINQMPILLGGSEPIRSEFVTHVGGTKGPFCFRQDQWAYVMKGAGSKIDTKQTNEDHKNNPQHDQLFDLATDPSQNNDLSSSQPEKAKEMLSKLREITQKK